MIGQDTLTLLYEGSVKRVLSSATDEDKLWFEFTDDYSVFDWGKMPDTIANKGNALAVIGAFFFDQLERHEFWQTLPTSKHLQKFDSQWLGERWQSPVFKDLQAKGAPTHFKGLLQGSQKITDFSHLSLGKEPLYMEVERAIVVPPEPHFWHGNQLYFYETSSLPQKRLIPLEIVFRFGLPTGSSLTQRLERNPDYIKTLGLNKKPQPDQMFDRPVIEFFTKLEPKDRLLPAQEAALLSGLSIAGFEEMTELAFDTALALFVIFAEGNIELWDGKVEMILSEGDVKLADSIGPDELRLIYKNCQLSKEMIRQVYRGSAWEKALKEAQAKAATDPSRSWKDICVEDLGCRPDKLAAPVKTVVDHLYGVLANHLTDSQIFPDHPELEDFIQTMPSQMVPGGTSANKP
jgi:phosphoribosylaminoimidazole-succinocarboxamide synthase